MKHFSKNFLWAIAILVAISLVYSFLAGEFRQAREIPLSEVVAKINAGEVSDITIADTTLRIKLKDGSEVTAKKENETGLSETLKNYGVDQEKFRAVNLRVDTQGGLNFFFGVILPILGPVLLIGFFIWYTARQVQRGSMQAFTFGQSRARLINPENVKERITFKDVAGVKESAENRKSIEPYKAKEPVRSPEEEYGELYQTRGLLLEKPERMSEYIYTPPERVIHAFLQGENAIGKILAENPFLRLRSSQAAWDRRMGDLFRRADENLLRSINNFFRNRSVAEHSTLEGVRLGIGKEVLTARLFEAQGYSIMYPHELLDASGAIDLFVEDEERRRIFAVQVKSDPRIQNVEVREIDKDFIQTKEKASRSRAEFEEARNIRTCLKSALLISKLRNASIIPLLVTIPFHETYERAATDQERPLDYDPFSFTPRQTMIDKWKRLPYFQR